MKQYLAGTIRRDEPAFTRVDDDGDAVLGIVHLDGSDTGIALDILRADAVILVERVERLRAAVRV